MKRTIVFIIALLSIQQIMLRTSFAQDTTRICDYSVFPVGAIHEVPGTELEKLLRMNFCYGTWGGASQPKTFPQHAGASHSSATFRDPFYYPNTGAHFVDAGDGIYGRFFNVLDGKDIRIFMPGTSGVTQEYNYGWYTNSGHKVNSAEWRIEGDTLPTGYVARLSTITFNSDSVNPAMSDPFPDVGSTHRGSFSYDFVFFIDSGSVAQPILKAEWDSAGVNDPLYSIEYWVKKSTDADSVFTKYLVDTITKKTYRNNPIANTQVPGRKVGAENLSTWFLGQTHTYRIEKDSLRFDTLYVGDAIPQVDVRIKNFHKIPIYVRCLRIRNWVAHQLLTGNADAVIKAAIDTVLKTADNASLPSWTNGNEPFYPTFHCFVYLNDLFQKEHAPPLSTLAPWNTDEFIRVERDQSENNPTKDKNFKRMFLWHEVSKGSMGWYDGSPGTHYNWDYPNYAIRPLLPSTFSTGAADSADWYTHAVFIETNYSVFTDHWQNTVLGYPSEAVGGGSGRINDFLSIARACYELDPNNPIPYYGCYSAMASPIHGIAPWTIDSLRMARSKSNVWADSLWKDSIVTPYLSRHSGDYALEADSLYHLWWDWLPSTEAETRFDLWMGICYGLKGYVANAAYEDIGSNDGFLWDSSGTFVKSYDRTYMRLDHFLYPGATGQILFPFSRSAISGTTYKFKSRLLPAFTGMYNAIKDDITNELAPIVNELSKLNWKGTVSWYKKDSTRTYLSRIPLKNLHSKNLAGTLDPDSMTYVQVSVFQDPVDSVAKYVAMLNRRLWTDTHDTLTTDSRAISFSVDSLKFNSAFSATPLWRITDVSGKIKDTIITAHDNYSFTVKPGQGKLFRIAPAIGLTLGEMSTNIYNNSRHVSPIEYNKDSVLGYVATYEKNGQIFISYPTETPTGLSRRTTGTPADTLAASDANFVLHTPSVAYDSASHTVGIVYCGIKSGVHDDTAKIFFKSANYPSTKYNFGSAFTINLGTSFIVPQGYTPAPSIMPTNRSDGKNFWIGWTDTAHGGNIVIEPAGGGIPSARASFNFDLPIHAGFVSLAAHKNFPNTVQIAYQESDQPVPTIGWLSHIFYLSATFNGSIITTTPPLNISAPFGNCLNYHPQICLTKKGIVDVAWEIKKGSFARGDRQSELLTHICVFKTRNIAGQWAKSLTAFTFDRDTLPVLSQDPIVLYPNILHSDDVDGSLTSWSSFYRLMWNDAKTNSIAMAINGRSDTSGGAIFSRGWEQWTLAEPSLEPSLPHLAVGDRIAQPVLYRSPVHKDDGNFDARITQYDFPKTALVTAAITKKTINLLPPPPPGMTTVPCKPSFNAAVTTPYLQHDTTALVIAFVQSANSGVDSTVVDSVGWDDYAHVKTVQFTINPGDTIQYGRYFRTGYNRGDTTSAGDSLKGSTDYLKTRILLRSVPSNTIVAVLDSAMLKESGLTQSADTANAGIKSYIVPGGLVGTVYMTLEASRGDATNGYSIAQMEYYNDSIAIDIPPSSDTVMSYKKSDPTPTSQLGTFPDQIKVSVVPNPFKSTTRISVDVPKDIPLNVTVFDALGRQVTRLFDGISDNEFYQFTFGDQSTSTGVFYVRVQAGGNIVTRKIQLVK